MVVAVAAATETTAEFFNVTLLGNSVRASKAFPVGFLCSATLSHAWCVALSKKTQLGRPCKPVLNESIRLRISHVPPPAIAASPVPNQPKHPHEAVFVSLYAPPAYPGMLWDPFPRPTCVGHAWVGLGACRGPSWVNTVKSSKSERFNPKSTFATSQWV